MSKRIIIFDLKTARPLCVLLQAVCGGSTSLHPIKSEHWIVDGDFDPVPLSVNTDAMWKLSEYLDRGGDRCELKKVLQENKTVIDERRKNPT